MGEEENLFGKLNESEMEKDIDLAIKGHKISEIRSIEEFILSYDEVSQRIGGLKH